MPLPNECSPQDNAALRSVREAQQAIDEWVKPITENERVTLEDANGRVLAENIVSPMDVPPHDNSAMDGYALNVPQGALIDDAFEIIGQALAGHPFSGSVEPGQAVRIMTGAVMPKGSNAVVMQERVTVDGPRITLTSAVQPRDNLRPQGDDVRTGDTVLQQGTLITPMEIGLLASLGLTDALVTRPVRVCLFSTGDELCTPGSELTAGGIFESNRYALHALLKRLPIEITDLGILPDSADEIKNVLYEASQQHHLIITSGGVSVGEADHTQKVLHEHGNLSFWKVAMKPGKPLAFGELHRALFLGLPGNPVSAITTFLLFGRRIILRLAAARAGDYSSFPAVLSAPIKKRPGREDYQRGVFHTDNNGQLTVRALGHQGSHLMQSLTQANCFVVVEREDGDLPAGSQVRIIPFNQWT